MVSGSELRIQIEVHKVTLADGSDGELASFTVWRDGKQVDADREDGGRLLGQRYTDLRFAVSPFPSSDEPIGWMLTTMASCGTRSHQRARIVTLAPKSSDYAETTFDCAQLPVVRRVDGRTEVWGSRERVDAGAASVFTPFAFVVGQDAKLRPRALESDWRDWAAPFYEVTFGMAFMVGLDQHDARLMRRAVRELLRGEWPLWAGILDLSSDETTPNSLADAVEDLARAEERLRQLTNGSPQVRAPPR